MIGNDSITNEVSSGYFGLYEQMSLGYFKCKANGLIIKVNEIFCKLVGYSQDELLAMSFHDISYLEDGNHNLSQLQLFLEDKIRNLTLEKRYIRKDKSIVWVKLYISAIPDNDYNLFLFDVIVQDITEQKKSSELLKKLATAIDFTQASIVITDSNGNIEFANPYFTLFTGYSKEEYIGKNPRIFNNNYFDKAYYQNLWDTITSGKTWEGEFYNHKKNGELYWEKAIISPITNEDNIITNFVAIKTDITARKIEENDLKETKETLFKIFDMAPVLISISEISTGKFLEVNSFALKYSGFTRDEVLGHTALELGWITLQDRTLLIKTLNDYGKIESLEMTFKAKNGNKLNGLLSATKINVDNKECFLMVTTDITERKDIEKELNENRERLRFALEGSNDGLWDVQMKSGKVYISPRGCEILGYGIDESESLAKSWNDMVHPDDLPLTNERLQAHMDGKSDIFEVEQRLKMKSGEWKWILTRGKIVSWENDHSPLRMTGTHTDINLRKQAEFELIDKNIEIANQNDWFQKINEELTQVNTDLMIAKSKAEESDRLKTSFLQNISHEIRTPMNAIMGFSELLIQEHSDKTKRERYSEYINLRCRDLLGIITDILEIAKIESNQVPVQLEKINLKAFFNDISNYVMDYQKRISKEHIDFNIHLDSGSDNLELISDKIKLKQIFINLINNAFKFTNIGSIEVGFNMDPNQKIIFYIKDSGIGIHLDKHKLIFERFYQLNTGDNLMNQGNGLGLSIVKGLLGLLGGEIWLESEPGKGSTFFFTITTKSSNSLEMVENDFMKDSDESVFPDKNLLIVEDDLYNADYFREILSGTQMNIIHTSFGKEAVRISLNQPIDLVLMDIRLPDINGYEATRQIRQMRPDLKIIVQTAYASNEDRQKAINAGANDYISKPIKYDLLMTKIKRHLSGL